MYSRARLLRLRACGVGVVRHPTIHSRPRKCTAFPPGLWRTPQVRADCRCSGVLTRLARSFILRLGEAEGENGPFTISFHVGANASGGVADSVTDGGSGCSPAALVGDEAQRSSTPGAASYFPSSGVYEAVAATGQEPGIPSSVLARPTVPDDEGRDDKCLLRSSDTFVTVADANRVSVTTREVRNVNSSFLVPAPSPSPEHPSMEPVLSREKQHARDSLFSRTGAGDGGGEAVASAAGAAYPTPVPGCAEPPVNPITMNHALYSDLFRNSFVNPFNGRLVNKNAPTARLLFGVGFYQSELNPLQLEWSPTEYVATLQKVQLTQQRKAARVQEQQVRKALRAAAVANETRKSSAPGTTKSKAGGSGARSPVKYTTLASHFMPVAESMEAARNQMLRPFLRCGPNHWTASVAKLLAQRDVFTHLNSELERLYSCLRTAYMPPKLDAPIDSSSAGMTLTPDQHQVVQLALRGLNLFVGGSAGTGKTVLLKCIYRELSQLGLRVAMTATTGVAAVQLGGCTFHHAFNAPFDTSPHRWDANALRAVDVVIIDEVSLLDACMLDAFDMEARLARMHHSPFGGLQVIACGDFLQLSHEETLPSYESAAFKQLMALRLVTPMRHRADDPLLKLLEELRRGQFDAKSFAALDKPIPSNTTHITYLFPRRREAQQLNDMKLCELTTQEMIFTPQRGPLHLSGTFTHSALVELDNNANGMRAAMPQRERLLEMIHQEASRLCAGGHHRDSSERESVLRVADHELVLMPVRVEGTPATRFVLRLRYSDRELPSSTGRGVVGGNPDNAACASPTRHVAQAACDTPTLTEGFANNSLIATSTVATGRKMLATSAARRVRRSTSPFTDTEWEEIAAAIAVRLGGRLVAMLEEEPPHMVPLSVSMTLADMNSSEVALSLMPLRLKLGCRVMVNRNLSRTVLNGSVGVVEAFAPPDINLFPRRISGFTHAMFQRLCQQNIFAQLPIVRFLGGEVVQIPPISMVLGGTAQSYFYAHEVLTIPLQLGYAFTVHKVQGLTLDGTVVLDCQRFFDCPHLIYVACSRVRRLDQLVVHHVRPNMIIVRRSALEFSDMLQDASDPSVLTLSPTLARASWAQSIPQRILPLSV